MFFIRRVQVGCAITNPRVVHRSLYFPSALSVVHYWIPDKCLPISGVNCAVLLFSFTDRSAPPLAIFSPAAFSILCRIVNFFCARSSSRSTWHARTHQPPKSRFSIYFTRAQKKGGTKFHLRNVVELPPRQQGNFQMTNTLTVWAYIYMCVCVYYVFITKQRKMLINLTSAVSHGFFDVIFLSFGLSCCCFIFIFFSVDGNLFVFPCR